MQGRDQQVELHLGILHLYQLQGVDDWTPMSMWASDPTVDPENWRAYSYCDTAESKKQTLHSYYWFRVTTVFWGVIDGTFSVCLRVLCPEKCLKILTFSCAEFFFYCAHCPGMLVLELDLCPAILRRKVWCNLISHRVIKCQSFLAYNACCMYQKLVIRGLQSWIPGSQPILPIPKSQNYRDWRIPYKCSLLCHKVTFYVTFNFFVSPVVPSFWFLSPPPVLNSKGNPFNEDAM